MARELGDTAENRKILWGTDDENRGEPHRTRQNHREPLDTAGENQIEPSGTVGNRGELTTHRMPDYDPEHTIAIKKTFIKTDGAMYKLPCPHCGTGMVASASVEETYVAIITRRPRMFCAACGRRYPIVKVYKNRVVVERIIDGMMVGVTT